MIRLLTVVVVFALAYAATLLFELNFITRNPVRYALTCLLVVCILAFGWFMLRAMSESDNKKE